MGAAYSPGRLLADHGPRSPAAIRLVRALTEVAPASEEASLARVAPAELAAFCAQWGVADAPRLLRAVHTHYAIVLKKIAVEVLAPTLARPTGDLRSWLVSLESGALLHATVIKNLIEPDEHGWYLGRWTDDLAAALAALFSGPVTPPEPPRGDMFKDLYHALIPGAVRHALGEFYTPDWLAEHTLDLAGYTGDPRVRCLDASCGSGMFLVHAIHRAHTWLERHPRTDALDAVLAGIVGFDVNPLAVLAARVNYVLALGPLLRRRDPASPREIPVHRLDTALHADDPRFRHAFDVVVGNPPHVSWRHLPAAWRRRAIPQFERHGLFTLTGLAAQHGGSQKDIAALFICNVVDHLLRDGGTLALVVHVSLFKTEGAGEGFRRFRVAGDVPFRVEEAHDFSAFQPFHTDADRIIKTRTLTFRARKGEVTEYPVPYHVWTRRTRGAIAPDSSWSAAQAQLGREELAARPLRGPQSPWMCTRRDTHSTIKKIVAPPGYVPAYHAHVGAYTGGLNGCYWLEVLARNDDGTLVVRNCADVGKKPVRAVETTIEPDLVYPLLRGRQTARWLNDPDGHILMVQDPRKKVGHDEAWLRSNYPRTHRFLEIFKQDLLARPVYRKFFERSGAPFYSMYAVRSETFAPTKVVWMEISDTIKASVLGRRGERVVVPDHKVILVAVGSEQEGDYLAGVLNSEIVGTVLRSYAVDNNVATNLLKNVVVPAFDPASATHTAIAAAARDAHLAAAAGDEAARARAEAALSIAVDPLWG